MSKLENLVAPLDLCKRIAAGKFEDSALVWWGACVYPRRHIDGARFDEPYRRPGALPAPTLAEILDELSQRGLAMLNYSWSDLFEWWECSGVTLTIPQTMIVKHDPDNPATAALRLYLEVCNAKN